VSAAPPDLDLDALLAEALAQHQAGRTDDAAALYETLLDHDPDNGALWINLGAARRASGRPEAAATALRRAVELQPDEAGAWYNLANALADAGDTTEALAAFATAAGLAPGMVDIHLAWAGTLVATGAGDEAVTVLEQGLRHCPGNAAISNNLGNALLDRHRVAEALPHLEAARYAAPDDAAAGRNLANALRLSGRLGEAEAILGELIGGDDDDADAHCLRAFARFAAGNVADAWDDYAWRWRSRFHEAARPFPQPEWDGQSLDGKSLLVWGEQAVGDELMFATMLTELQARAGKLIVETEHRLHPLLERAFPGTQIVTRTEPPAPDLMAGHIDFQIAIGDLGRWLRPDSAAFERNRPYLRADADKAARLRAAHEARAGGRPCVGISWKSGADRAGVARSLDHGALKRLLGHDDVFWVSLQYGDIADDLAALEPGQLWVDDGVDPLRSLDDLAAQMATLDLVVSVANTTVHLAGALGIPTLAMLAKVPDWRWMAAGGDCVWYPSVRLLRQRRPGDWSEALEQVEEELAKLRSC